MATTTDFLGLSLPEGGEGIKRIMFNGNFELIDNQAKDSAATLASAKNAADAAISYSKTLYVDSASGSDDNNGSETAPFLTFAKAMAEAKKYRACIINLAGGTYPTTAVIDIRGACAVRIFGLGTSDNPTILNGRFSVGVGAYLTIGAIKVIGETTTANGSVFVWEGGHVYMSDCTIAPTGGYGINANTNGSVYAANCTFDGSPTAIARTLGGSQITLRSCADKTGTSVLCQNVGRLELNGSSAITYRASGTGFVSVDNVQRYPIDLSTLTATTSE